MYSNIYMLYLGDCLDIIPTITQNINMVLVDLPYGITKNAWDTCIDLSRMWLELKKICTTNCIYCFTCTSRFGHDIISSNKKWFMYDLIWEKSITAGFLSANKRQLRKHEMIYIFSNPMHYVENVDIRGYFRYIHSYIKTKATNQELRTLFNEKSGNHCWRYESSQFVILNKDKYNKLVEKYEIDKLPDFRDHNILNKATIKSVYNPQMTLNKPYKMNGSGLRDTNYGVIQKLPIDNNGTRYPTSILKFNSESHTIHPTQKPVLLLEYLIKTYSNPGDVVLDFTMGSGSCGVACKNTKRKFIGIEKDKNIFFDAVNRIW